MLTAYKQLAVFNETWLSQDLPDNQKQQVPHAVMSLYTANA